ncbi:hypothetical protein [Gimesia sp.]|uniref:hypothetical protein n=1 Tax=Gimesia sp. TaxID=2024833 RepID=UPI003A95C780
MPVELKPTTGFEHCFKSFAALLNARFGPRKRNGFLIGDLLCVSGHIVKPPFSLTPHVLVEPIPFHGIKGHAKTLVRMTVGVPVQINDFLTRLARFTTSGSQIIH